MKIFLNIILFISFSFCQTIIVQVVDKDKSFALSEANIIITGENGTELGCSPDVDGVCVYERLSYGVYNVSANFIGYETLTKTITVSDDVDYKVTCLMTVKTILYPELKIISDKKLGVLIVKNRKGKVIGIITDGQIRRSSQKNKEIQNLRVKEVMTKNPISVDKDILAAKALSIMNTRKITSLCVYNKKNKSKTIGILHIHNVLENNVR